MKTLKKPLKIVKNDLFNITRRIKEIDKNYFIAFNTKTKNFEVHNFCQSHSTFCFIAGKQLNASVLTKTKITSVKYFLKNLKKMQEDNLKLTNKTEEEVLTKNRDLLSSYISYFERFSNKDDVTNAHTTKWF